MPKKPNKLLRTLVPLGAMLIVIGLLAAVYVNQVQTTAPTKQRTNPTESSPDPVASGLNADDPNAAQAEPVIDEQATATGEPTDDAPPANDTPPPDDVDPVELVEGPTLAPGVAYRTRTFDEDLGPLTFGAADASSPEIVRLELSPLGMGIRELVLTTHFRTIAKVDPEVLQAEQVFTAPGAQQAYSMVTPFAALGVTVNGQYLDLIGQANPCWRAIEGRPGFFEAFIVDGDDAPVLRIERGWEIDAGSYDIRLRQSIENLSGSPIDVQWAQLGPSQIPPVPATNGGANRRAHYGGDMRRIPFGYLERPAINQNRQVVSGRAFATQGRQKVLGKRVLTPQGTREFPRERQIWPNERSLDKNLTLVWSGMKSRYHAVVAHPLINVSQPNPHKAFDLVETIDRIIPNHRETEPSELVITQRFNGATRRLDAGGLLTLDMGVYAGPVWVKAIENEPAAMAAGLDELVFFSLGGMCSFCTFQDLTDLLIVLLRFLHDYVVFDWGLAIIVLVVIVRTCLHPVTRWSQIRINRFGKEMQALAPKQQKINEKYKNDPKRKQEEMAKLMREEGINPAGMLGCLPMIMQMPVWIALYATLFFAFDLQHQPAFFGIVQQLIPLNSVFGHFLGDLSEPDRFMYFGGRALQIPLIGAMMGDIASVNILPIFLGVVFWAHQKYLTPTTTASLTPEQQQQQKIMKVMMVVMFPVFMYNAPCGLVLYFIANSLLGIVESRHIRSSAEKKGLLDVEKKPAGKPGFMQRMMELAEQQQQAKNGGRVQRHPNRGGTPSNRGQQRRSKRR